MTTSSSVFGDGCGNCADSQCVVEGIISAPIALDEVVLCVPENASVAGVQISGTWDGTLVFEGTIDDENWVAMLLQPQPQGDQQSSTTANGLWQTNVAGYKKFRVRAQSALGSGVASVVMRATGGSATIPLPDMSQSSYTWSRADVELTGADNDQLLPIDATRRGVIVRNRAGNSDAEYDLSGIAVVDGEGLALFAGGAPVVITAPECPTSVVTVKGQAGDILSVWIARLN